MKIFQFLDFGNACGCSTIEDTYNFIDYHAPSMFSYDCISKEMTEILNELKRYNFATSIKDGEKTIWQLSQAPLAAALDVVNCCDCTNLKFSEISDS